MSDKKEGVKSSVDEIDAPAVPKESPKVTTVKIEAKKVVKRSPVLNAPKVCPPGYRLDASGKCRKIL
ncbi:hypothetical protein PVAND_004768 [Polypedilum vanderplanki]|uniref:Uncharacterized protein n=1 Tax=Polypedilum vanderplanki TaxID=319348 RepID=A0A9J6BZ35_POLVA|nr:hypothetical protein PVAND_004768 [Polypedilum vanderplanki]